MKRRCSKCAEAFHPWCTNKTRTETGQAPDKYRTAKLPCSPPEPKPLGLGMVSFCKLRSRRRALTLCTLNCHFVARLVHIGSIAHLRPQGRRSQRTARRGRRKGGPIEKKLAPSYSLADPGAFCVGRARRNACRLFTTKFRANEAEEDIEIGSILGPADNEKSDAPVETLERNLLTTRQRRWRHFLAKPMGEFE